MTETQASEPHGLEPTRDPRVTLPDLLEVLLNKGVYLNLDAIVTVADIPLIGINLRATIAGIETMLEYGMMRSWDERTRAWVQRSVARHVPLADGEELVAKMAGGHHLAGDVGATWRPGTLYLTTRRLIAYRRDPQEILWQTMLESIDALEVRAEQTIGGEERGRLHVTTTSGDRAVLSAAAPERLRDLIRTQVGDTSTIATTGERTALLQDQVWYREERAGGHLWRGGTATLDEQRGLTWKGALDARPAVRLAPHELLSVTIESGRTPTGRSQILAVGTGVGTTRLASQDGGRWLRALSRMIEKDANQPSAEPTGTGGAA